MVFKKHQLGFCLDARGYLNLLLGSLLGQQHSVDVGQYTPSRNGHARKQLAQLLVIAHSQLNVAGYLRQ